MLSGFPLTLMLPLIAWEVVVPVVGGLVLLLAAQNLPPARPARPSADTVLLLLVACSPGLVLQLSCSAAGCDLVRACSCGLSCLVPACN